MTDVSGGDLSDIALLLLLIAAPWVLGRFVSEFERRADTSARVLVSADSRLPRHGAPPGRWLYSGRQVEPGSSLPARCR